MSLEAISPSGDKSAEQEILELQDKVLTFLLSSELIQALIIVQISGYVSTAGLGGRLSMAALGVTLPRLVEGLLFTASFVGKGLGLHSENSDTESCTDRYPLFWN